MPLRIAEDVDAWDVVLPHERARLVRLCAHLTHDVEAAEDVAQETLVRAWRHGPQLREPDRRAQWLSAIARRECLRWTDSRRREMARRVLPVSDREETALDYVDHLADAFDVEVELERDELARLLDRALALLPPQTRDVLVERYIEEAPLAEVAARLGLTESAVAKRVERGKVILRRLLLTDLPDVAAAYGLAATASEGWQETRIWCTLCGQRHLLGRFQPGDGFLSLRCPQCGPPGSLSTYAEGGSAALFNGVRGYKPALTRLLRWGHDYWRGHGRESVPCTACGSPTPVRIAAYTGAVAGHFAEATCPTCGQVAHWSLSGIVLALPAVRQFWQRHGRIRMLPEQQIEVDGATALVTRFESVTAPARLEVVALRDTFEIIPASGTSSTLGRS